MQSLATNYATSSFLPLRNQYYRNLYCQNFSDNKIVKDVTCLPADGTLVSNTSPCPNCKLETDELLRLFSVIGTPEFLERSNSILLSNSNIATRPDQSYLSLLSGDEIETTVVARSSFNGFSSGNQVQHPLKLEKLRQNAMYDLPFWNPKLSRTRSWEEQGRGGPESSQIQSSKGSISSRLGFVQYARSLQPFKMNAQNVLATQSRV